MLDARRSDVRSRRERSKLPPERMEGECRFHPNHGGKVQPELTSGDGIATGSRTGA
jgi:hypothetical protein